MALLLPTCLSTLPARAADDAAPPGDPGASLGERALALVGGRASVRPAVTVDLSPVALPSPSHLVNGQAAEASVVDYRAWVGGGRTSLGIGLTAAAYREVQPGLGGIGMAGPLLTASSGPMLGLGLRYQVSRNSQFTFDSLASGRSDEISPQVRVGMEFRSPPSQVLGMARGTFMRAQLSSSSQVSLNWRGGKVALLLRSQF